MNMMTPETLKDLTKDAEVAENPALARLMKAWESKNAKRAAKGSGLTLMAVSLAACGGSSDDDEEPGPLDQVFTLTLGDDTLPEFQGGAGNDTFDARLSTAIDGTISVQTLQEPDVLDGGAGENTLNATLNGTGAAGPLGAAPSISNIQIFNLTATNADGSLNLINSTGYMQLWNINSDSNLTLNNVREGAVIGLDGTNGGTTYQVNYTSAAAADIVNQTVVANAVGGSAATGQVTDLDITDAAGDAGIETLTLVVSNGVRMELLNSAENIENLIITGSGALVLSGENDFPNLVTLNSNVNSYTGDLTLDVSGSEVLEEVLTGGGDDIVTVNRLAVDGDFTADMGEGDDTLVIAGVTFGGLHLNPLDFTGGVANVQTIAFPENITMPSTGGTFGTTFRTLDLDGVSDDLTTLSFASVTHSDPNGGFLIDNIASDDLLMTFSGSFTFTGAPTPGVFSAEGVENLTIESTGGPGSNISIGGGMTSETLVNLAINAADDATLFVEEGLDLLETVSVDAALGNADVTFENFDGDEFGALESVAVSAGNDAELNMTGRAPVQQVQTFTIAVAVGPVTSGTYTFEYMDSDGETQTTPASYVAGGSLEAANAIADAFDALDEFSASVASVGGQRVITITREDAGEFPAINLVSTSAFARDVTNQGAVSGVDGAGFEALEDVVVTADDNASVNLTNVYGDFTVDVTAGENGIVSLTNTEATSASLSFGTNVEYTRDGDGNITGFDAVTNFGTLGVSGSNPSLESIEISGAVAYVPLPAAPFILPVTLEGDLNSLQTIDLTGVTEQFLVDATDADFGRELGEPAFVTYLIGGTSSEWAGGGESFIDSSVGNRETFKFTEAEFGTIVINGFDAGSGGDRINLADLGITNEGQLVIETGDFDATDGSFTINAGGDDVRILDDQGAPDFTGTIILIGTTEADLVSDNFALL